MLQNSVVRLAPPVSRRLGSMVAVGSLRLVASPHMPLVGHRNFSLSAHRKDSLRDDKAVQAANVSHIKDRPTVPTSNAKFSPPSATGDLTREDFASTLPQKYAVQDDWVLFHPVYSPDELKSVEVLHREATCLSDKLAANLVKFCRWGYDFVSGYKHKEIPPGQNMSIAELRKEGYILDDKQWLSRILFLESIAGVPGMVAATLRHLQSLRLMRRDNGWIHTCLEEAENERMHLMTFMTLRNPSMLFRAMVLGAQGVFYNLFFLSYLVSPRTCHRFVGHLEEEAVITYTRAIEEIEAGRVPEWSDTPAPQIAIDYWRLAPDAKLLDVIYAVRSDETTHRFVNHSLANLDISRDVNPFALREPDMHTKGKKIAFERNESERYLKESRELLQQAQAK